MSCAAAKPSRTNEELAGPLENRHHLGAQDMEMMNRAIEDARDFRGMMEKMMDAANQAQQNLLTQGATHEADGMSLLGSDRQPGENRAAHRARLKAERRSKARKVPA